jgi:hypothetical protein
MLEFLVSILIMMYIMLTVAVISVTSLFFWIHRKEIVKYVKEIEIK